jgi:hypothetical protein
MAMPLSRHWFKTIAPCGADLAARSRLSIRLRDNERLQAELFGYQD